MNNTSLPIFMFARNTYLTSNLAQIIGGSFSVVSNGLLCVTLITRTKIWIVFRRCALMLSLAYLTAAVLILFLGIYIITTGMLNLEYSQAICVFVSAALCCINVAVPGQILCMATDRMLRICCPLVYNAQWKGWKYIHLLSWCFALAYGTAGLILGSKPQKLQFCTASVLFPVTLYSYLKCFAVGLILLSSACYLVIGCATCRKSPAVLVSITVDIKVEIALNRMVGLQVSTEIIFGVLPNLLMPLLLEFDYFLFQMNVAFLSGVELFGTSLYLPILLATMTDIRRDFLFTLKRCRWAKPKKVFPAQ